MWSSCSERRTRFTWRSSSILPSPLSGKTSSFCTIAVGQFAVESGTPKALANCSPGLVQPWVTCGTLNQTLKAFGSDEPFQSLSVYELSHNNLHFKQRRPLEGDC